jgi:myo-inositol 2-dehydrogenase/D-chiro-inositol 1-dehydrogenase
MLKQHKPDVAVYRDHEKLLVAERPDAVFISTPNSLHVPVCRTCVEKRIPFFVEKPLSSTAAEALPLVESLRRAPLTHMVGYVYRYYETFAKARALVGSNPLGKLVHVKGTMYVGQLFREGKGWRYDRKASGGGVLISQNSHLIDMLAWLFGPIEWVSGHVKSWHSREVEDFCHSYLAFESGLSGFIDTTWSARHYRLIDMRVEVEGENGTLSVTEDDVRIFLDASAAGLPAGWTRWRKPDLYEGVEIDMGVPAFTRQDQAFLKAVAAGTMLESNAESGYHTQQVIDAIYESSGKNGHQVYAKRK